MEICLLDTENKDFLRICPLILISTNSRKASLTLSTLVEQI
jgi:hypothetical protein